MADPSTLASGDYALQEELGRGSVGTVFRAILRRPLHTLPAGAEVAIKFLRQELATDEGAVERLRREGDLGQQLDSPYVVRILGVVDEDVLGLRAVALVMELVRGPTLRRFLRTASPVVDDLCRRIGRDAARGLAVLHARGLVHRDVKPENMALTPEGQLKLMDLGLAWNAGGRGSGSGSSPSSSASSAGFFGSLAYAAPETLRGRPATAAADRYALGLVMYELLTGRHPFADALADPDQILHAHLERDPERPSLHNPRASPLLEAVVLELLRKEPALRLGDTEALAEILEQGEASEFWRAHVEAAPVEAAQRRLRAMRRFAPTPLFGRDKELVELRRRLQRVLDTGRGSAIRVTGPEGIGRRRLLDEWLAAALDEHGARIELLAGSPDHDAARARGTPFPTLLRELHLDGESADAPRVAERLAERVRAALPGCTDAELQALGQIAANAPLAMPPAQRADLLARALRVGPDRALVIRIDHADQLDATAEAVVERLLARVADQPILLVLVMHARAASRPFEFHDLRVRGLAHAAFVGFAHALFAETPAAAQVDDAWHALAGSPGALVEALEDLGQRGLVRGRIGALEGLDPGTEVRPAAPLLTRVRERVADLDPDQRRVLVAAAILGERFPLADLCALAGEPELLVLAALSVFQGRVVHADRDTVAFRHRDFRTAFLDLIGRDERRALHRAAAAILQARGAAALRVGMHLSRASDHAAAVEPLLRGLADLVAGGSRRAAPRVLARLRVHLDALPPDRTTDVHRLRCHQLAADLAARGGQSDVAGTELQAALRLAESLDDAPARSTILLALARTMAAREQTLAALATLDAAWAVAGPDAAGRTVAAAAMQQRARIEAAAGDASAAFASLQRAREVLPKGTRAQADLHLAQAHVEVLATHFVRAAKSLRLAERRFRLDGDGDGVLQVLALRANLFAAVGATREARAAGEEAVASATQRGEFDVAAQAHLALGEFAAWRGEIPAARTHLHEAIAAAHAAGNLTARAMAVAWLRLLGIPMPTLPSGDEPSQAPGVRVLRALVDAREQFGRGRKAEATAAVAAAQEVERAVDLPLHLRLLVIRAAGQGARADEIAHEVSQRLPARRQRHFLRLVEKAARLIEP